MIVDLINSGVLPKGSTQSVMEQKMSSGRARHDGQRPLGLGQSSQSRY